MPKKGELAENKKTGKVTIRVQKERTLTVGAVETASLRTKTPEWQPTREITLQGQGYKKARKAENQSGDGALSKRNKNARALRKGSEAREQNKVMISKTGWRLPKLEKRAKEEKRAE